MIRSMTGYGGAKGTVEGLSVTVELKSVNNRYLDIAVRMPRNFLFAEDAVKSTIQQHVSRGKLDVFVTIDSSQPVPAASARSGRNGSYPDLPPPFPRTGCPENA